MKHFGFLLFSLAFIGLVIRVRVSKDQNFNIIFKPDTRQFLQQFFFIFLKLINLIFYIFYLLILLTITIAFLNLLDLNLEFEVFVNPFFFIWHQLHHFALQRIEDFLLLSLLFSPSTQFSQNLFAFGVFSLLLKLFKAIIEWQLLLFPSIVVEKVLEVIIVTWFFLIFILYAHWKV